MIHGINAPKFLRNHSESVSVVILPCNVKPNMVGFMAKFRYCNQIP